MAAIVYGLTLLSLIMWIGLLSLRGQFWRTDQKLEVAETVLQSIPNVCVVIPARNEAELLPITLRSLLNQDYAGDFNVFLVDDRSTDGTAAFAQGVAYAVNKPQQLHIISGEALPAGWSGKLWALEQGIEKASALTPDYYLLTDADIEHDISNLRRLVAKAEKDDLDMVSVMVRLRCQNFWEQLLIPAFVFFFQKLYPFRWVNNPKKATAAAAGGSILIRSDALAQIGGISSIRQTLIDDCSLAAAVKQGGRKGDKGDKGVVKNYSTSLPSSSTGRIWLGLSTLTRSLRPYPDLEPIWNMVARTAYTQLNYSPLLLAGTVVAMTLIYLVPPVGLIVGGLLENGAIALTSLSAWLLMTLAYLPTIRFYKCPAWLALCLPAIAFLYTMMTIDSAIRHWQGRGGAWKGRVYP